ncbi:hypothetical protein SAMN05216486_11625 [bacterium JGI 053]|nr:hypothetical protein SAMN05216486_11625 [bacterium JGI 053]
MKKLSLKPEDLCVESFGTLPQSPARGTVQGAADTKAETCTCPNSVDYPCGDTISPSCPHTCGIVIAPGAAGDGVLAPQSWNCPCM